VLSAAPPKELIGALAAGDAARFQAVPGIGKRTAERIIVELRGKVAGEADAVTPAAIIARRKGPRGEHELARAGLLELGYTAAEADELLREAGGESAEELIGQALRLART